MSCVRSMSSFSSSWDLQSVRQVHQLPQAAIRAGYSAKTAAVIGNQNLRKLKVSEAIEKAQSKRAERFEVTADWVVDELRKIDVIVLIQLGRAKRATGAPASPSGHPCGLQRQNGSRDRQPE